MRAYIHVYEFEDNSADIRESVAVDVKSCLFLARETVSMQHKWVPAWES